MSCPYCKNKNGEGYEVIGDYGEDDDGNLAALSRCLDCGKEFIQIYAIIVDWDNPIDNIKLEDYVKDCKDMELI